MHILSGESALRALRAVRCRELPVWLSYPEPAQCLVHLPESAFTEEDISGPARYEPDSFAEALESSSTLEESGFAFESVEHNARVELFTLGDVGDFTAEYPLELGVFERSQRIWRKKSRTRLLSRNLPEGALVRVRSDLYFVCPELIVLHMAARLSSARLAQLIMELCGSYSLQPDPEARSEAKYQIQPVTTLERIRCYLGKVRVEGGRAKVADALDIAMEGSASPAETLLALMMSLPPEAGGYGFARPVLNAQVRVPEALRDRVGGTVYYPDVFWQGAYTDCEFESVGFHLDPTAAEALVAVRDGSSDTSDPEFDQWRRAYIRKAEADRRRLRELQFLGVQVIPVTQFDLQDVEHMDQLACSLAKNFWRVAVWCEGHPEDVPWPEQSRTGARRGRRSHKWQADQLQRRLLPPSHWEAWPSSLDERSYREVREALLCELKG